MKINELHIKNIASIEKADIDFDNDPGLIDPDTGQPARMFLIYGDTGTGKSILLDGIAMALFGKTPRTESIENKARNTYTNAYGNQMSITSIEQYARLGITEKDECYSEVVFTGNDGIVYRAKMDLSLSKIVRGKSKGQLQSRKRWMLKQGDKDWIKGEDCGKQIEEAIGLNYDQFNRMAMLAQGMFANFLCGSREERADILERLTNTSIFSDYGRAIRSIFDRKKAASDVAQKAFETAQEYILPADEAERLATILELEGEKLKAVEEEKRQLSQTIGLLDKIADGTRRLEQARQKLAELNKLSTSEEYLKKKELCSDWDKTDIERKALTDLLRNRKTISDAAHQEEELKSSFAVLAGDYLSRMRAIEQRRADVCAEELWLTARADYDLLFSEAKITIAAIGQYAKDSAAHVSLLDEIRRANELRLPLSKQEEEAAAECDTAKHEVDTVQDEINKLSSARDVLDPKLIDSEMQRLSSLSAAYQKLSEDYVKWVDDKKENQRLASVRTQLLTRLQSAQQQQQAASAAVHNANAEYEAAIKRWTAINASLDEKLNTLRQTIRNGGVDICPLCGQKIADTILTKEEFASLVTPYEIERQRTKANADTAGSELTAIIAQVSAIDAELKTVEQQIAKLTLSISDNEAKLAVRMQKADIRPDGDVIAGIEQKQKQIAQSETVLHQKRSQLLQLQNTIDEKLKSKAPLDERLNRAAAQLAAAKEKAAQNNRRIADLTLKAEKMSADILRARQSLDAALTIRFPQWASDVQQTVSKLQAESDEYTARKRRQEENKNHIAKQQELLSAISQIKEHIGNSHPDWTVVDATHVRVAQPINEWSTLASRCSALSTTIANCRQAVEACERILQQWRSVSGKSDDYLEQLSAKGDEVLQSRRQIAELESDIKISNNNASEATALITQSRSALGIDGDEALPDKGALELQLLQLDTQAKESTALLSEARTKLDSNKAALLKMEQSRALYDKAKRDYDHWNAVNRRFGGDKFRNLVQTHILLPLLNNANIYLHRITDRYTLTCTSDNEQLSILVLDRFNRNEVRSAAVLSGGEKFMISLSLSLALSSLNRPTMNVNILFIDEGFGTLDQECLSSVMSTLSRLGEMSGQSSRRVGIISHREELLGCIPNKIKLRRIGEGRSRVETVYEI